MQKYKKPVFKEEDLGNNPCVIPLTIPIIKWENTGIFKKEEEMLLFATYDIEVDKSTKLYISSRRRKLINNLGGTSSKLLLWIMQELESNKDYLWVNKMRFMEECNIASNNTFLGAITELQKYNFIQPSVIKKVYWINPDIFFLGSRVKKYPNNIVVVQDKTIN
jgi:hypothetical protein